MSGGVMPELSLVVSTIGRPDYFRRFLENLARGRTDAIELILVDQDPERRCTAVLADVAPPFPHQVTTSARGASVGRNAGAALATAPLIAFPDDDCWYTPDTVAQVLAHFGARHDLAVLCGRQLTADGQPAALRWDEAVGPVTRSNYFRRSCMSTMFFSRTWFERVGGFDDALGTGSSGPFQSGEESDLLLRVMAAGGATWYDPGLVVHHPDERTSTSPDYPRKMHGYGIGQGALWRRHHLSRALMAYLIGRKVAAIGVNAVRGQRHRVASDWAWVHGWVEGMRLPVPEEPK